ncbi:MAG: DNA polymerase Y family protein [Myxococcota bacterium]|nr:DNA polymerase Y family protein [Myxococcota bacterium]
MPPRIACLLVPNLPLHAEIRAHPDLATGPLAVASGPESRAEIIAASPAARSAGVQSTHSVAQARAACPELRVRVASPALERAAREALLDVALSLSPRAEIAPRTPGLFFSEGKVFLDASGIQGLFHSEQGFASALLARSEAQGLPGLVAVASSRSVSLLAARHRMSGGPPLHCLPREAEASFLAPLALDLFDPDDRLAQALTRLGIHTVRDLLRLPRRGLAQRLGPGVLALLARARGEDADSALPEPTSTRVEEAIDLENPVDHLEPLGFILRGLISRLCERLALRGLACGALDLRMRLEGGAQDARRIGLAAPSLDLRVLLRLTTLALAERAPHAPIEQIALGSEGIPSRTDQLDLFLPRGPDPAALGRTLTELESICGEGRVGMPQVLDHHDPLGFALGPFTPPGRESPSPAPGPLPAPLPALRAIRPPLPAEVRVHGGKPAFVRSAVAQGDVVVAAGPWRTTGYWWSEEERFALDHFDLQVSDGSVIRLGFDWIKRSWQIDGIYD